MPKRPEDKLVDKICKYLDNWVAIGVVVDYENLSNAGRKFNPFTGTWIMNTQKGRRDVVAYIKHKDVCYIYLIEAKTDVGVQSPDQKKYEAKFNGLTNVVYEVVRKPSQVSITIERITGYYKNFVDPVLDDAFKRII